MRPARRRDLPKPASADARLRSGKAIAAFCNGRKHIDHPEILKILGGVIGGREPHQVHAGPQVIPPCTMFLASERPGLVKHCCRYSKRISSLPLRRSDK